MYTLRCRLKLKEKAMQHLNCFIITMHDTYNHFSNFMAKFKLLLLILLPKVSA